ncbi:MAG: hypothetical protein QXF01_01520 [Candidatus Micrarchaeaceae archaeon]
MAYEENLNDGGKSKDAKMEARTYICKCGSREFRRYIGDKTIYCKKCGQPAPPNVRFKHEYQSPI